MIDLHCHIIPAVDDGADSYDEALSMISAARETGTKKMIVTPHYYNKYQCTVESNRKDITERFFKLKEQVEEEEIPIELYLGSEQFGITNISSLIEKDELITLNNSRYLLIEFDFNDDIQRVKYVISQLTEHDIVPVIAHPERYDFFLEKPSDVYYFLEQKCLLQINKGSPLGRYGDASADFANWLLDNRMAHVVASDCHSPYERPAEMCEVNEFLYYKYGERYTNTLMKINPQKIIDDAPVYEQRERWSL